MVVPVVCYTKVQILDFQLKKMQRSSDLLSRVLIQSYFFWDSHTIQSHAISSKTSEISLAFTIPTCWNTKLNQLSGTTNADFRQKDSFYKTTTGALRWPSWSVISVLRYEVLPHLAPSPDLVMSDSYRVDHWKMLYVRKEL